MVFLLFLPVVYKNVWAEVNYQ